MSKIRAIQAMARGRTYEFLSLAFATPSPGLGETLESRCEGLEASLGALGDDQSLAAARDVGAALDVPTLERAHVRCFGHAISKECPPYEMEYGEPHIFQKTQDLADVAGFYRAFGLEIAPDFKDRPDHLSAELEFMEFLCAKEARARARGHSRRKVALCRDAQAKFLSEHLGRWTPAFARRLEEKAGGGFYGAAARLLACFVAREARSLGIEPAETGAVAQPEPPESTAGCGTCPLAADSVLHEEGEKP